MAITMCDEKHEQLTNVNVFWVGVTTLKDRKKNKDDLSSGE